MTYLILFFTIYAFTGWVLEVIYTRFDEHRWVNRGFLKGPFCPIYGLGAVSCLIFLAPLQHNMLLFIPITMVTATLLEYLISSFFDAVFNVTLWSYSHKKFNYKGRICLEFTILWGIIGFVFTTWIHPNVDRFVNRFSPRHLHIAAGIASLILMLDLITSVAEAAVSTERLKRLERVEAKIQESNIELAEATGSRLEIIQAKLNELNNIRTILFEHILKKGKRLFSAFPTMRSKHFPNAIESLKEHIEKVNQALPFRNRNKDQD